MMPAEKYHINMNEIKYKSVCGKGSIAGQSVMLVKPQTYMNNSGEAVGMILNFYKLDPASQMIVMYDDISLDRAISVSGSKAVRAGTTA